MQLSSILLSFVPTLLFVGILKRWRGRLPLGVTGLSSAYLWGAFAALTLSISISGAVYNYLVSSSTGSENLLYTMNVYAAPVIEEMLKIIPLAVMLFLVKENKFSKLVLAGSAVGLGFAAAENIYFFSVSDFNFQLWLDLTFNRVVMLTLMHTLTGVTAALIMAYAADKILPLKIAAAIAGIAAAVGLHIFWNYTTLNSDSDILGKSVLLGLTALYIVMYIIYKKKKSADE